MFHSKLPNYPKDPEPDDWWLNPLKYPTDNDIQLQLYLFIECYPTSVPLYFIIPLQ
jgi:hypothetical protein